MAITEIEADGVRGLLDNVLTIAGQLPDGGFLWFRGQSCADYVLRPKILRDGKTSDEVFERERRLLTRFRQRSMAYWPAGYPQDDWEHLFAMQHFGMPTRLLDWSESLFVAAHFAITDALPKDHQHDCTPIVWCISPSAWNRSTPVLSEYGESVQVLTTADDELDAYRPETTKRRKRSPIAMFGAHNSARIVAQRGTFMVWGNDVRSLEEISGEQANSHLWKIKVNGDRTGLAASLRHLGFSETMVFPELPSLSVELSRTEGWK